MQSTFCTVFVMLLLRSLSFSLNKFFASRKCFHYCFSIGLISPKLKRKVTPFEMNAEHGKKKNGIGDQKNSKERVPKQAQGNPILTYWQLPPTNKHKSLLHQDAQVLDNQNSSILRIKRVQIGARQEQIWPGFDLSACCVVKKNENSERFCRGKCIFSRVKWE